VPLDVAQAFFRVILSVGTEQVSRDVWKFVDYDCVEVSINFAINKIPQAYCTLATGRELKSLQPANIHLHADDFVQSRPVKLTLYADGDWVPNETRKRLFLFNQTKHRWKEAGPQLIFKGYLTGIGYQKSYGQTVPIVYMTHWLSDLSFSSALSDQSHPANPAGFRWWAANSPYGTATTSPTSFMPDRVQNKHFEITNIEEDLWSKSLHQMFADLSEADILTRVSVDSCLGTNKVNVSAQDALRYFETSQTDQQVLGTDHRKGSSSPFFKPLAFKTDGSADIKAKIALSIREYLRTQTLSSYFSSTIWDKLVGELAPAFSFAIVPRVQTVDIVPFVCGLRKSFGEEFQNGKFIDFKDVDSWSTSAAATRPLRAVGILPGSLRSETNYNADIVSPIPNQLGGCFLPDTKQPGMLQYRRPPWWLENVPLHDHDPQSTLFPTRPSSATTPQRTVNGNTAATRTLLANYYDRYAQFLYAQEMLRGRSAIVHGKLRFDLAPGTTILIQNAGTFFIKNDQLARHGIGTVTRMNISLNAAEPSASTTFQLDGWRTAAENETDRMSIDHHPLYETIYTGAPLVDEYLFSEN
jgi:hypothetical protein